MIWVGVVLEEPTTSRAELGLVVPIPTLLLTVSTFRTVVPNEF